MTVCEELETDYGLKFNVDKCELFYFGTNYKDTKLKLNGHFLEISNKVKYLGNYLENSRDILNIDNLITDLKVRSNMIMSNFSYLNTESRTKIFNAQCTSFMDVNF